MLAVTDLHVHHGGAEVLHGVSIAAEPGEIVGLIGPNGAGKTTLLLSLSGIVPPSRGQILFQGEDIAAMRPAGIVRRGLVHVPQGRLVFPAMTVAENLLMGAFARQGSFAAELDLVYTLFPILKERRTQLAGSLSGGQQQMLALGRGLMAAPKILLLDEPQLGLSPALIEQVSRGIADIHAQGCTILLVGQHAPLALALSSRLYVLEAGNVALSGTTAELAEDERIQHAYLGVS